ncbi:MULTISPECIES: TetR family transcriptional regulator [unclassified Microbacterium]|uniref:TetR family transcriptional regulator n=1 Tax=unclassified Microbacterium TaxID=2609290 RepID=UPI000F559111|nr:TetR family transcriptional regulator [Microbacterium sp. ABRD28]AZC13044.1 TetR family transcriptional regulator [Microbacterium sp. ABRD28]
MPRWPEDSRERLVDAAISLFVERGFAATTVEQIATAAGVTPRTFFRHFGDKEEVLFTEEDELLPLLLGAIASLEPPFRADELMRHALGTLADRMEPERTRLRERHAIIKTDVALTGRELAKQAAWQPQIAAAIAARGYTGADAELLAAIGFALYRTAFVGWLEDDAREPLRDRVDRALPSARTVMDLAIPG